MNEEIVYLTFPTTKKTAHAITELAHVQGTTQPKLLDKICQDYIQESMIKMFVELTNAGIDVKKLLEDKKEN